MGNPSKKTIKNFAEKLYMAQKEGGLHRCSWADIKEEIQQKHGKRIDRSTVGAWSKEKDDNGESWESRFKAAVAMGVKSVDAHIEASEALQEKLVAENRNEYLKVCESIRLLNGILDAYEKTHNNELALVSKGLEAEKEREKNTSIIPISMMDDMISYKKYGEFRRRRDILVEQKTRMEDMAARSPVSNDAKSIVQQLRDLL